MRLSFPVRSINCLAQADIDTIAELVIMPEPEMLKFRNFGKKSLNEIKAKLEEMHPSWNGSLLVMALQETMFVN